MRAEDYGGIPITSECMNVWMHAGVDLKEKYNLAVCCG